MSKPQITLGFVRRRKVERLQEFKDGLVVGMLADDVLKLAEKKLVKLTRRAEKIAESDYGYIVNWFYPGVIITLQRESTPGAYKISNIKAGEIVQS